jgi:hypothetical protein
MRQNLNILITFEVKIEYDLSGSKKVMESYQATHLYPSYTSVNMSHIHSSFHTIYVNHFHTPIAGLSGNYFDYAYPIVMLQFTEKYKI